MDTVEPLEIRSDLMSATISPLGAELQALRTADGVDLQWNGDPKVWKGRAPILFPVIGFLNQGRHRLDQTWYTLSKHGFARDRTFTVIEHTASAVRLRLLSDETTRAAYPFEFQLDLVFTLDGVALSVVAEIGNRDQLPLPASFGFHPAFRWPLPFGQARSEHGIVFESDEPGELRRIDSEGLLRPARLPSPIEGQKLMLRDDLFEDDALIFDQVESRRVVYGAETGPKIAVSFPDFPVLGIWSKPGAGFVCIEPWAGLPDPEGYDGDFRSKPRSFIVAPNDTKRLAMTISLVDPAR